MFSLAQQAKTMKSPGTALGLEASSWVADLKTPLLPDMDMVIRCFVCR